MSKIVNEIMYKLYHDVDGMQISLNERDRLQIADSSLTYGEILPDTFTEILAAANPKPNEVFYDLGSGTGKAVFCAALLYDWRKACGVELLPALYDASRSQLQKLNTLPEVKKHFPEKKFNIEFLQQDFLKTDLSDADVIFMHATTFGPMIWEPLKEKLNQLKSGLRVIVNTKQLDAEYFEKINEQTWLMGWGDSTVFTYVKK